MAAAIRRAPRWVGALAGAALAAAVLTPLLWGAGGAHAQAPPGPPAQQVVHFVVFDRGDTGTTHDIDVGKKGPSPGDFTVALHSLYDPSTKQRIGSDVEQVQVVHLYPNGDGWVMLHATAFLRGGHIQADFPFRFSQEEKGFRGSVTGGTGAYANTSGTLFVKEGSMGGHPGVYLTFDITKAA